jgi:hypothetical protein
MNNQVPTSVVLADLADFFEQNPHCYTSDYVAVTASGQNCGYLSPQAVKWDIVGLIGKTLWEKYGFRTDLSNLHTFKRLQRAFNDANQVTTDRLDSPLTIYVMFVADTVFDVIEALRKASKYAKEHGMDEPLDLTPAPPSEPIGPFKLYI